MDIPKGYHVISIHTLTWRVTWQRIRHTMPKTISIHTLTWRVTCFVMILSSLFWFQSTPSRGGWRSFHHLQTRPNTISIHTLTWRVTVGSSIKNNLYYISIHTLTWRVTHVIQFVFMWVAISIHTLTWRVTSMENHLIGQFQDFNPHPHVEGDT